LLCQQGFVFVLAGLVCVMLLLLLAIYCYLVAAELRRCCCLRELHLEHNRLVTPLLDLTHATSLGSLQVLALTP
jgi:hypothetical protein